MLEKSEQIRRFVSWFATRAAAIFLCAMVAASCASAPTPQEPVPGTTYFERAIDAAGKGRYLAAIDQYTRYIDLHKDAPQYAVPALNNRGTVYWTLKRYNEAIEDFSQAIEMDTASAPTFINRGNVYADMNEMDKAIQDYTQAIDLDANNGLAYSNRGLAWSALKRFDMAIPDLDKAIELGHEGIYKSLMKRGVIRFGTKDYEGAVEDFSRIIQLYPEFAEAFYFRGLTYQQMNEPAKAQEDFQKAAELQKAGQGQ
ncbi:MAG: tetratricopeptide repeat protein [Desulfatibacillum sp.]|nr:tetratricopeptide repeat protein [Desulfatibacillum sp.]